MALSTGKNKEPVIPKPKSTLLQQVLKQVVTLPLDRQDSIAIQILDSLSKPDPKSARFQQLIEKKYTVGLSAEECTGLEGLEADFRKGDDSFYGPILKRVEQSEPSGMLEQHLSSDECSRLYKKFKQLVKTQKKRPESVGPISERVGPSFMSIVDFLDDEKPMKVGHDLSTLRDPLSKTKK